MFDNAVIFWKDATACTAECLKNPEFYIKLGTAKAVIAFHNGDRKNPVVLFGRKAVKWFCDFSSRNGEEERELEILCIDIDFESKEFEILIKVVKSIKRFCSYEKGSCDIKSEPSEKPESAS